MSAPDEDGKLEASEAKRINNEVRPYSLAVLPVQEPNSTNSEVHQPRQPSSLQDLMRYAIEARDPAVTDNNENHGHMDKEKSEFLMDAIRSIMHSESELALKALETVRHINNVVDDEEVPKYIDALHIISEHIHDIDVAHDFVKNGGMPIMHKVLCVQHESLQICAANIIGNCAQNNTEAQMHVMKEQNLLQNLMDLIHKADSRPLKLKALFAVSCTIRNYPPGFDSFRTYGGFEILKKVLEMDAENFVIKAAYLIHALSSQEKQIQEEFVKSEFVQLLISRIEEVGVQSNKEFMLEALVLALNSLVDNNDKSMEIMKSSKNLKSTLEECVNSQNAKEAYLELTNSAVDLLRLYDKDDDSEGVTGANKQCGGSTQTI